MFAIIEQKIQESGHRYYTYTTEENRRIGGKVEEIKQDVVQLRSQPQETKQFGERKYAY